VVQDYFKLPAGSAVIMAHEMGHNFGFRHDDEIVGGCDCDDPTRTCIMNTKATSVIFSFCLVC